MREIKFKIWNKNTLKNDGTPDNERMSPDSYTPFDLIEIASTGVVIKEKNFVILQFTGLKDKNGKEIYEGDILRMEVDFKDELVTHELGVVQWNDSDAWWQVMNQNDWILPFSANEISEHEIIGNIYQNPELLK